MTATPPPSDGSALCTSCGLCCDGALFNRAVSKPEQIDRLASFGITAITVGDRVRFPCRRPTAQRDHFCRVTDAPPLGYGRRVDQGDGLTAMDETPFIGKS